MPKREGKLFERYITRDNFDKALGKASKNKKRRPSVMWCLSHRDEAFAKISSTEACLGEYVEKTIKDPSSQKVRKVMIPKFHPYQIMHHMIANICYPILFRGAYRFSCGSIKGKGGLYASEYIRKGLKRDPENTKYFAKLDVRHFYDSVDHYILKRSFRRVIKDERFLRLMDSVVDSVPGGKGLPIGNYTSQIFANYYLQGFDHYVKEKLKVPYYVRYMDDMVIIGPNRRKLEKAIESIKSYLSGNLQLSTHGNEFVVPVEYRGKDGKSHGSFIDLVGYRHYRGHTTIRRRDFKRIRRCVLRTTDLLKKGQTIPTQALRRILSYWGMITNSDSEGFRNRNLNDGQMDRLREAMSQRQRKEACA